MAQDVVTAREVAAPVETALQFQDAERIGEKLDEALAEQGYRGTAYSGPVRNILQLAWAVAAHKQSTRVTVYHLAYALAFDSRDDGERLAEYLESDVDRSICRRLHSANPAARGLDGQCQCPLTSCRHRTLAG